MSGEQQQESTEVTYEKKLRSVRVSSTILHTEDRQYLVDYCTNDNKQMVCQICCHEMPFKVNGVDYFEAVRFVKIKTKEVLRNKIALCPLCAAKWLYANLHSPQELLDKLRNCADGKITVILAGKAEVLHFYGKHLTDLRAALKTDGHL